MEDAPVENKEKDEDSNDKETEPESADKTQTLAKNGSSSSVQFCMLTPAMAHACKVGRGRCLGPGTTFHLSAVLPKSAAPH